MMTLFLLCGFTSAICAQEIAVKDDRNFFYDSAKKTGRSGAKLLRAKTRPTFFDKNIELPNVNLLPPNNRQTAYVRPNKNERFKKYLKRTFGVGALAGNVASAGFAQIRDSPEEWENNIKGFGRRLASSVGRNVITQTTIYCLDEAFRLDSNYYKSNKQSIKERFKNAFLSTFTARRPDGKRVFGFPRIIGVYTGAIISREAWYPPRYNYKDGIRSGTISLGTSVGINFVREFF